MNYKQILLILILVIIVGGGTWWIATKYKPPVIEEPEDEITILLTELKAQTGVNFSDIKDVEFEWMTVEGSQAVQGKGFEATRVSDEEFRNIGFFFADKGFKPDVYNIAAGTVSGLAGYKLVLSDMEQIVCHYIGGVTGYKEASGQWIPPEPDLKDVEVKCGKTEIIEPEVFTEEAIKKLFAEKYNKKLTEITVNITKETENHAEGGVIFGTGGVGERGIFLIAKVGGQWQLVFDGQGAISCDLLRQYDFPEEMMEQCAEIPVNLLKEIGEEFSIPLKANPTTGYQWNVDYDSDLLELVDRKYEAESDLIGAGGLETFKFKALKSGTTQIKFSYLRPWETGVAPIQELVYEIVVR